MCIWLVANHRQLSVAEAMLADVESQQSQLKHLSEEKLQLQSELAGIVTHEQMIGQLGDRASLVIVLADLSRNIPENVKLTRVTMDATYLAPYLVLSGGHRDPARNPVSSSVPSQEQLNGQRTDRFDILRLEGIALGPADVIEFASALERSGLFADVYTEVVESGVWSGRAVRKFALLCEIIPHERSRP
ncbi:MAG: PilN domain-containing protein [Phycisphaerae bacterium]|nr:PilN domain-containing protein [Phycisphaerae bacterium]